MHGGLGKGGGPAESEMEAVNTMEVCCLLRTLCDVQHQRWVVLCITSSHAAWLGKRHAVHCCHCDLRSCPDWISLWAAVQ